MLTFCSLAFPWPLKSGFFTETQCTVVKFIVVLDIIASFLVASLIRMEGQHRPPRLRGDQPAGLRGLGAETPGCRQGDCVKFKDTFVMIFVNIVSRTEWTKSEKTN